MPDSSVGWLAFVAVSVVIGLFINLFTPSWNVWSWINKTIIPKFGAYNRGITEEAEHYSIATIALGPHVAKVTYTVVSRLLMAVLSMSFAIFSSVNEEVHVTWVEALFVVMSLVILLSAMSRMIRMELVIAKIDSIKRNPGRLAEAEQRFDARWAEEEAADESEDGLAADVIEELTETDGRYLSQEERDKINRRHSK